MECYTPRGFTVREAGRALRWAAQTDGIHLHEQNGPAADMKTGIAQRISNGARDVLILVSITKEDPTLFFPRHSLSGHFERFYQRENFGGVVE